MQLRTAGEVWQEVQLRPQPTERGRYAVTLSIDHSFAKDDGIRSIPLLSKNIDKPTLVYYNANVCMAN